MKALLRFVGHPRDWGIWTILFAVLLVLFAWTTYVRFLHGLGASTNLSDRFPWGLWIGFDVLCGVGLAAGAFTLTAVVHIFNLKKFEPIVRPTVLTGFLGYVLVSIGLLYDIGQPWRLWHAMVYWNPRSVMFEVAWCVMLYTTVLALELSPVVFERFKLEWPRRVVHSIATPLVILGVLLSTLHQSSLGTMFLIVPEKLHPLWYSPLLPLFFFLSAIGAGIGMVILESHLSGRAFGRELELDLLEPLARAMVVVLSVYGLLRLLVLRRNGALADVWTLQYEGLMFLAEFLLGVVLPVALLSVTRIRHSRRGLVACSFLAVIGFVMHRLNVSVTGLERAAGGRYIPSWMEVVVSLGLVGIGIFLFALAASHLPIFPEASHGREARETSHA